MSRRAYVISAVLGFLLAMIALASCGTITEIRDIHCDTMTPFWNDSLPQVLDSVRFSDCRESAWEGMVVRTRR